MAGNTSFNFGANVSAARPTRTRTSASAFRSSGGKSKFAGGAAAKLRKGAKGSRKGGGS